MHRMAINPEFPLHDFTAEFSAYRKRFSEGVQKQVHDILWTTRLEQMSRDALQKRLEDFKAVTH